MSLFLSYLVLPEVNILGIEIETVCQMTGIHNYLQAEYKKIRLLYTFIYLRLVIWPINCKYEKKFSEIFYFRM